MKSWDRFAHFPSMQSETCGGKIADTHVGHAGILHDRYCMCRLDTCWRTKSQVHCLPGFQELDVRLRPSEVLSPSVVFAQVFASPLVGYACGACRHLPLEGWEFAILQFPG